MKTIQRNATLPPKLWGGRPRPRPAPWPARSVAPTIDPSTDQRDEGVPRRPGGLPHSISSGTQACICVLAALAAASGQNQTRNMFRFPPTGGDRIRTEAHLLPEVSTGPLSPSWSPDGKWLAVSFRGDIWKVPAEGGAAIALTKGPGYHFEPAWSPDGRFLAFSEDINRNLEIGIIPADGGDERIVASHSQVDIEPAWA